MLVALATNAGGVMSPSLSAVIRPSQLSDPFLHPTRGAICLKTDFVPRVRSVKSVCGTMRHPVDVFETPRFALGPL